MKEEQLAQVVQHFFSSIKRGSAMLIARLPFLSMKTPALYTAIRYQDIEKIKILAPMSVVSKLSESQADYILSEACWRARFPENNAEDTKKAIDVLKLLIGRNIYINETHFKNIAFLLLQEQDTYSVGFCVFHIPKHCSKSQMFVNLFQTLVNNTFMNDVFDAWQHDFNPNEFLSEQQHKRVIGACCRFSSEYVLKKIISTMDQVATKDCYSLLDRRELSYNTLKIFVDKGLNVDEIIHQQMFNRHGRTPHWENMLTKIESQKPHVFEAIKEHYINTHAQQTKTALLEGIDTQSTVVKNKRKM